MTYQTHKKILFPVIIFFSLVLFFSTSAHVEASSTYGRAGWLNITHSIDGDDDSCGSDEVSVTLEVRDSVTGQLVNADSSIFMSVDFVNGDVHDSVVNFNSSTVGTICWNPSTQSVQIDADGGSGYYNFITSTFSNRPTQIPRQKAVTGIVWLTPITEGYDYDKVYPSPTSLTIASSSPEYTYTLNRIPSIYGADGIAITNLIIHATDEFNNVVSTPIVYEYVNQVGRGVGEHALPSYELDDGWYIWYIYISLNRNVGISENVPMSGVSEFNQSFVLDTTPPTIDLSRQPSSAVINHGGRIRTSATDDLSGVTEIDIYVNDTLERSCSYASVYSATCEFTFDSLPAGEYEYYAVAKDRAGNTSISEVGSFEVSGDNGFIPGSGGTDHDDDDDSINGDDDTDTTNPDDGTPDSNGDDSATVSLELRATPTFVRSGSATQVILSVDSISNLTCEIANEISSDSDTTIIHIGSSTPGTYTFPTKELYATQAVIVNCNDPVTDELIESISEIVEVIPVLQER